MSPRPLHRWKSFWFGMLVLAVLGCAWVRSMRQADGWTLVFQRWQVEFEQGDGRSSIQLSYQPMLVADYTLWHRKAYDPSEPYAGSWFADAYWWRTHWGSDPGEWRGTFSQAHWLLILLFLIPWLAFLFWRIRKQRRLPP